MLPDLTDQFIDENYGGLLHTSNTPISSNTLNQVYDGLGNAVPIKLSKDRVEISNYQYPLSGGSAGDALVLGDSNIINFTAAVNLLYPVGSVYMSTAASNPATIFGGIWNAISQGRVLIGVGTGVDKNALGKNYGVRADGDGEYAHTQTTAELARHNHPVYITQSSQNDDNAGANPDVGTSFRAISPVNENANGLVTLDVGSSTPMNSTQPSFGIYIWERTA